MSRMELVPEDLHKTFRIKLSIYETMSFYVYRNTKVQGIKRHKSNGRITVKVKQTSSYLGFLRYYIFELVDVKMLNAPMTLRLSDTELQFSCKFSFDKTTKKRDIRSKKKKKKEKSFDLSNFVINV